MAIIAEYIWIDGTAPTAHVRSKTRVIHKTIESIRLSDFPQWAFDGSSTNQAEGGNSDRLLEPVCFVTDPVRGEGSYLVLCEVYNPDGTPHTSNHRATLRAAMSAGGDASDSWMAFEQEYTFFRGSRPLGFGEDRRYPAPQGPYYCGVGADEVYGRPVVEKHLKLCLQAGIMLTGINAEVMPGQWEYQCGGPNVDPLTASDHLWLSRWLLYRVGEDFGISATLDPKPVPGDWNGAGMHTNFSTAEMRAPGGIKHIIAACKLIGENVERHIAVYGAGNEFRLTGHHETCSIRDFKYGVSDRTASIRIPLLVDREGCGYLEDRRPAANADPYQVCNAILRTTLGLW
ncbi:MAG: glutamine synthetase [Myxococcota bacterium]|jgi:glutamine synthetase